MQKQKIHKEPSYETVLPDELTFARDTVRELTQQSVFLGSAYENNYDMSDSSNDDYLYHVKNTVEDFVASSTKEGLYTSEQLTLILLMGSAPFATRQSQLLNSGVALPRKETSLAKDALIEYNSVLFEAIEQNDELSVLKMAEMLATTATDYTNDQFEATYATTLAHVRGIRTEHTFKSIVESHGDFSIRHGNAQEERRGIDFVVKTPNMITLKVDLKSSLHQVQNKLNDLSGAHEAFARNRDGTFTLYLPASDSMYHKNSSCVRADIKDDVSLMTLVQIMKMEMQASVA